MLPGRILLECFEQSPSPMTVCVIEAMGGAASRIEPTATAFPHRKPGYSLLLLTQWADPADTETNITWTRETFEPLQPHMSPRRYVNYFSADDDGAVRQAYGRNYERLTASSADTTRPTYSISTKTSIRDKRP
jgi:hypothetical protein